VITRNLVSIIQTDFKNTNLKNARNFILNFEKNIMGKSSKEILFRSSIHGVVQKIHDIV